MKFRLLQARNADDPVRREERQAFADRLQLSIDAVEPWDLLEGTTSYDAVTAGVDAVLVGGSGEYSVYDDQPWLQPFFKTLGDLADKGFPTFASCFGFQGMVVAAGGEVVKDEPRAEVGTFELTLTDEGAADPLFGHMPTTFLAQLGHKDRALGLPSGLTNLAASERCPYQAIRIGDGLVYATQFHPELTGSENRARFQRYLDLYSQVFGQQQAKTMLAGFIDSPETTSMLRNFAGLLVAKG